MATDHLEDELLRGLTIDDLFDIAVRHRVALRPCAPDRRRVPHDGRARRAGQGRPDRRRRQPRPGGCDVPPRRARAPRGGGPGARAAAPGALTARADDRERDDRQDPAGRRGDPLAARAGGVLFERLGQPAVIGEIAAGIALGPTLLGAAARRPVERSVPGRRAGRAAADRPARARAVHVRRRLGPRPEDRPPPRARGGHRLDRVDPAPVRARARARRPSAPGTRHGRGRRGAVLAVRALPRRLAVADRLPRPRPHPAGDRAWRRARSGRSCSPPPPSTTSSAGACSRSRWPCSHRAARGITCALLAEIALFVAVVAVVVRPVLHRLLRARVTGARGARAARPRSPARM